MRSTQERPVSFQQPATVSVCASLRRISQGSDCSLAYPFRCDTERSGSKVDGLRLRSRVTSLCHKQWTVCPLSRTQSIPQPLEHRILNPKKHSPFKPCQPRRLKPPDRCMLGFLSGLLPETLEPKVLKPPSRNAVAWAGNLKP